MEEIKVKRIEESKSVEFIKKLKKETSKRKMKISTILQR